MRANTLLPLALIGCCLLSNSAFANDQKGAALTEVKKMALEQKPCASRQQSPTFNQLNVLAYDWLNRSGEANALYHQVFNNAKRNLDIMLGQQSSKPKAVVLDIDETVLYNNAYIAYLITHNVPFSDPLWKAWGEQIAATPTPGSIEFTQYAKRSGVAVFYVSNRKVNQLVETQKNLEKYEFADASTLGHILLQDKTPNKQPRFDLISQKYDIIEYFGDQLGDFGQAFNNNSNEQQRAKVEELSADFGWKYYQLPNPTYGQWQSNLLNNKSALTDAQKVAIAKQPPMQDTFVSKTKAH